jgi:hypothetical protein
MCNNYYTSIEIEEGMFVAFAYDANTNTQLYKSKPYRDQSQASQDVNIFLTTSQPPEKDPEPHEYAKIFGPPPGETIVNTTTYKPVAGKTGSCCGR